MPDYAPFRFHVALHKKSSASRGFFATQKDTGKGKAGT